MRVPAVVSAIVPTLAPLRSLAASLTCWNLFNVEGERALSARYVTYATQDDMLADANRLAVSTPDSFGAGVNIVGSGASLVPSPPEVIPLPAGWPLLSGVLTLPGLAGSRGRR